MLFHWQLIAVDILAVRVAKGETWLVLVRPKVSAVAGSWLSNVGRRWR
jgi:hypothetical protein